MQWVDEGIILSAHPLGDSSLRAILMTRAHGRHAGLVRGRQARAACQPGTIVQAAWRARLADHLGTWTLEVTDAAAVSLMDDRNRLSALASACALVESLTAERDASLNIYEDLRSLIALLGGEAWDIAYVRWELALLEHAGYPLDLSRCAATGVTADLKYVSPRTGRAVSAEAGHAYADRLLPLPQFLAVPGLGGSPEEIHQGLMLTGTFLARMLAQQGGGGPVPARERFLARYRKAHAL
ncbi:DNA repair protein RecO [Fodinicurvata sp. EGI_FJ10296]|uniref:DNA repair protein RecO n=1 Tax=Fodinicurvata sp. EGI_FJ10296 TaxID=3231908 RepID=UPI003454BBAD